jgi:hypothetical protein
MKTIITCNSTPWRRALFTQSLRRTASPLRVLSAVALRKTIALLTAIASLTTADAIGQDGIFTNNNGRLLTSLPTVKIVSANQSAIRIQWRHHRVVPMSDFIDTRSFEGTVYLTNKTVFLHGTMADAAKGQRIRIIFHYEGNRAIADSIKFIHKSQQPPVAPAAH